MPAQFIRCRACQCWRLHMSVGQLDMPLAKHDDTPHAVCFRHAPSPTNEGPRPYDWPLTLGEDGCFEGIPRTDTEKD